jgi:hypothetical protein
LFLYGELAQPDTLRAVLDLPDSPTLREAGIRAWAFTTDDEILTVKPVEEISDGVITMAPGVVFTLTSKEQMDKLQSHMGKGWGFATCLLEVEGHRPPEVGDTIVYVGKDASIPINLW